MELLSRVSSLQLPTSVKETNIRHIEITRIHKTVNYGESWGALVLNYNGDDEQHQICPGVVGEYVLKVVLQFLIYQIGL